MKMVNNLPHRITFQWHLTDKCNFRCKHCYQDDYSFNGLSFTKQLGILDQLNNFAQTSKKYNAGFKAHINFTGGEPFLREDFLELIAKTKEKNAFTYGILSNGYLLPQPRLETLKKLNPKFIQISLEGGKDVNDSIRGKGSYKKITLALKTYSKLRIPVLISFTANAQNYREFPRVVKTARKYKVHKVWTDRYLPYQSTDSLTMSTPQTKEFFKTITSEQDRQKWRPLSKTRIATNRALQFLMAGGLPYKCSAADTLLAILANGDLLPCRRLPIKMGNLQQDNLIDVYQNNPLRDAIHNPEKLDKNCLLCHYKTSCNGGLKCLSFATQGDFNKKDPNCWI